MWLYDCSMLSHKTMDFCNTSLNSWKRYHWRNKGVHRRGCTCRACVPKLKAKIYLSCSPFCHQFRNGLISSLQTTISTLLRFDKLFGVVDELLFFFFFSSNIVLVLDYSLILILISSCYFGVVMDLNCLSWWLIDSLHILLLPSFMLVCLGYWHSPLNYYYYIIYVLYYFMMLLYI